MYGFYLLGGFYDDLVLADYLDADRIPMSLAVPTAERVPMICGVELKLAQSPSFGGVL